MVNLKWSPPANDGGAPITNYVVEMKDKLSPDWKEVMKTDDAKCEAKVANLTENSNVQFRIKAINKAGPSEPSSETPMHIVKHRNCKHIFYYLSLLSIIVKYKFNYFHILVILNIQQKKKINNITFYSLGQFCQFI